MRTQDRNCSGCRYWSEMVAQSIGGDFVEALCLAPEGPAKGKYVVGTQTCPSYAKNTLGAVDDPPDYGESVRAAYAAQAEERHPNGAPKWAPDGTLLDEHGNRSIFDDVDDGDDGPAPPPSDDASRDQAERVVAIRDEIAPLLHGESPAVVSAVLGDLLSMLIAGHFVPGDEEQTKHVRSQVLMNVVGLALKLLPVNAGIMKDAQELAASKSQGEG